MADSALLLVSELVTNAVLHARSRLDLVVRLANDRLRVEVHDSSEVQPTRKHYSVHAGTGRGLMLVDQLAARWGVDPITGNGKRVWFELGTEVDAPDATGGAADLNAIERLLLGDDAGAFDLGDEPRDPGRGSSGSPPHRAMLLVG